jgi:DNA-binding transcriptional ArsR family regulator
MGSREETVLRLIADRTNRAVLTALDDAARGLSVTEIADRIGSSGAGEDRERTVVSLHHNHLPRLDEAGLIEYDREECVATAAIDSGADPEWTELEVLDEFRSRFETGRGVDGRAAGVLEGREAVYDYARELADEAATELFLVYTTDELLDADCLPHATDALDRGVELYAGATSQETRAFFERRLPRATIWDPQRDWLYDRSHYPRLSRLIVADRETVVVGLWEETADGTRREVGLIGEGATDPLVVLVRELLGPRLDHLDYQSDDFLERLPFET